MKKMIGIMVVVAALVVTVSCSSQSQQEIQGDAIGPDPRQQMASNQSISCSFIAEVVSIERMEPKERIKGYVIDENPKWTVELKVLSNKQKTPFQPGVRRCYIADVDKVFGSPRKDVAETYQFTYTWNVRVPGKPSFENFKAEKTNAKDEAKEGPSDEDGVITNTIGMKLKLIEPGEFMMGSEKGDDDERPVHKVKITKPFYIGVYEVTQAQYEKIMGKNPSYFKGPNMPVESISWDDVVLFCEKLSEKEDVTYRLPTEAEWEYACRAGTKTEYYWGVELDGKYAWHIINSERGTHNVGQKKPNAWGLYDMSGNVFEWCSDRYDEDYYDNSPEKDPQGPRSGKYRVLRGGRWFSYAYFARSAYRYYGYPSVTYYYYGFRCARSSE